MLRLGSGFYIVVDWFWEEKIRGVWEFGFRDLFFFGIGGFVLGRGMLSGFK